jgi:hypothetical protein
MYRAWGRQGCHAANNTMRQLSIVSHQQNQESIKPYLPMPEDRPIMTTKIYALIKRNLSQYQTM